MELGESSGRAPLATNNVVEGDNLSDDDEEEPRPLQILALADGQDGASFELIRENLQKVYEALKQSNAEFVSIVAVMGSYRTGKSFLLDLLLRYLKVRVASEVKTVGVFQASEDSQFATEEDDFQKVESDALPLNDSSNESLEANRTSKLSAEWVVGSETKFRIADWISEGDSEKISEGSSGRTDGPGFAWRSGREKCTEGIWIHSQPFVFTRDGQRIAVLLMDTQGAWDDKMTKDQSATIFGLTALLSSKLIYNIQNRIEEDKLDNLDYFTTFAQKACNSLASADAPFGHLAFLIRDWSHYDDGFNMEKCDQDMKAHMDEHLNPSQVPEDAKPKIGRLSETFRKISCHGLVHPGLAVTKPTYDGALKDINDDFFHLLDHFTQSLFGEGFPFPSAPLGCEITVSTFKQVVENFATAFANNQKIAIGLREAFVKVEVLSYRDEMTKRFQDQLYRIAPDYSVVDPDKLKNDVAALTENWRKDMKAKLKPFKMSKEDEKKEVEVFLKGVGEVATVRQAANNKELESANVKIVASPVVGCSCWFLVHHVYVLSGLAALGAGLGAKNAQDKEGEDSMFTSRVAYRVVQDAKGWVIQRWRDVQAIQVAVGRFQSSRSMAALSDVGNKAQTLALAASASTQGMTPSADAGAR